MALCEWDEALHPSSDAVAGASVDNVALELSLILVPFVTSRLEIISTCGSMGIRCGITYVV